MITALTVWIWDRIGNPGGQMIRRIWDWISQLWRKPGVFPIVTPDPLQAQIAEKVAEIKRRDAEKRKAKAEEKARLRGKIFWDSRRQGTYRRDAQIVKKMTGGDR